MRPLLLLLLPSVLLTGCALVDPSSNASSTVTGSTLLGAGTGALVGGHNGEPFAGALIGGTLGALAGESVDAAQRRREDVHAEKRRSDREYQIAQSVTLDQLLKLTQAGVADDNIIAHIQNKGAARNLTTEDIILLSNSQVSPDVIKAYQTATVSAWSRGPTEPPEKQFQRATVISPTPYPTPVGPTPFSGFHIGLGFGN